MALSAELSPDRDNRPWIPSDASHLKKNALRRFPIDKKIRIGVNSVIDAPGWRTVCFHELPGVERIPFGESGESTPFPLCAIKPYVAAGTLSKLRLKKAFSSFGGS